jgi:hypothetical protein
MVALVCASAARSATPSVNRAIDEVKAAHIVDRPRFYNAAR